MVRLAMWQFDREDWSTLQETLQRRLASQQPCLHQKRVAIQLELDRALESTACSPTIQAAVERVLDLAIARAPQQSQLLITACPTRHGLEIEIADDGDESLLPRCNAFSPYDCREFIQLAGSQQDYDVYGITCPQGGLAWTLVIKRRAVQAKAA